MTHYNSVEVKASSTTVLLLCLLIFISYLTPRVICIVNILVCPTELRSSGECEVYYSDFNFRLFYALYSLGYFYLTRFPPYSVLRFMPMVNIFIYEYFFLLVVVDDKYHSCVIIYILIRQQRLF